MMLAQLDRWMSRRGEAVILRRPVMSGGKIVSNIDNTMPAIVRALTVEQLIGAITQQNFLLIVSPTDLVRSGWPSGTVSPDTIASGADPRLPTASDKVIVRGKMRAVERLSLIFDAGQCVRIEISVTG